MAAEELKGANRTIVDSVNADKVDRGQLDTTLKTTMDYIEYPLGTDGEDGDWILMASPPKFSTIVDIEIVVPVDLSAGALTLDIGDEADDDRYGTLVDIASVGRFRPDVLSSLPYRTGQTDGDESLKLTVNGAITGVGTSGNADCGKIAIRTTYT